MLITHALSYFTELNKFGRTDFRGLDLKWVMQGPQESESAFLQRIMESVTDRGRL